MTVGDTTAPKATLTYATLHAGLNNQKLALFGLILTAFREGPSRVVLPDLTLFEPLTSNHQTVPYSRVYQPGPMLAFAAKHGIEILDLPPQGFQGWHYFDLSGVNISRAALLGEFTPDSFVCDFFRALVPAHRLCEHSQRLAAAVFDRAGICVAAQLRIERDWDGYSGGFLRRAVTAATEDNDTSIENIMAKIAATPLGDATSRLYVISDEAALPAPKDHIRNAVQHEFGIELLWKSDFLTESELASLTVLDKCMLDFEMALAADIFIGITRSTFSMLATLETYARTRAPVERRYVYNVPGPTLVERRDNGAFSIPALAIAENPWDSANSFHLAQIFHASGEQWRALEHYELHAAQSGEPEEIYIALYRAGQLKSALGFSVNEVTAEYLRAAAVLPHRAEASFAAARLFRAHEMFQDAVDAARPAIDLPVPAEGLFVEPEVYEWMLLDEYSVSAFWTDDWLSCADAALKILERGKAPADALPRIMGNLRHAVERLKQQETRM